MLKAVIDINLFVSGMISKKGNPAKLLQLWHDRAFLVVISEQMVEELGRVLRYPHLRNKYNLKDEEIELAVDTIKKFAIVLPDVIKLNVIKNDPDDNKVIECAIESSSDYILTYDRHLLKLKEYKGIKILKPEEILKMF